MSLTVGTWVVADARIQYVALRSLVGAYELIFGLYVDIRDSKETEPSRSITVIGAQVSISASGKGPSPLGFARPDVPFQMNSQKGPYSMTPTLTLPLSPGQLSAIEQLRDGSDLRFELSVVGIGADQNGDQKIQDTWHHPVPKSDWIKTLKGAGARNILLIEVPVPLEPKSKRWKSVTDLVQKAEEQYSSGDYSACVASCRTVIQELGYLKFKKKEWAPSFLDRLAKDRRNMTQSDRERALWATLHHYTHQAHHGKSEGGITDYSRAEAQLILTLAMSFLNRTQGG